MSGHHSNGAVQLECGARENHSYKHKEKRRDRKKHRDHKKRKERKEREKSAKHNDPSGKKHRHRDKDKHRHGSKDKHKHREKREDGKEKLFGGKEVKYEIDSGTHHLNVLQHDHSPKRKRDEDNSSVSKRKKIKTERDDTKWHSLEHKGPLFHPEYKPLPNQVKFYYNGEHMKLSPGAEEVATFYAKMLDHEYVKKNLFRENFFKDWCKEMTEEERAQINDLEKCDFREISNYFKAQSKARRSISREERQKIEDENDRLVQEYGFCFMDNRKERIINFRTEPPRIFRSIKEDHPKMGMLKCRIKPEDCIINCSEDSEWPKPPPGKKWKDVRHDNKVNWLVSWPDIIQGSMKYISTRDKDTIKVKRGKDLDKFDTARKLKKCVYHIRAQYRDDWKSNEMDVRQRAVALYFIDKLALRVSNEKEGEATDTVGCCSLKVEHIILHPEKDGKLYVVEFVFPVKDIHYYNAVPVEKRVFKNLCRFMENKQPQDDLFDRVTTDMLNKHLQQLMDGLTAKVFRTYNASITLQQQLKELTEPQDDVPAKILSYNRANRAVAFICNHPRARPEVFEASMQKLQANINAKRDQLSVAKIEAKRAKADAKELKTKKSRKTAESKKTVVLGIEEQLMKLEVEGTDCKENKQIPPGTPRLNYLDPRITVAWCKRFNVPIERIYNKKQRNRFTLFMEEADKDFEF